MDANGCRGKRYRSLIMGSLRKLSVRHCGQSSTPIPITMSTA